MKKSFSILLLMVLLSMIGCGNNTNNLKTTDTKVKKTTKNIYPNDVYGGEVVSLQYMDKSIRSYKWWDQDGNLLGEGTSIEWHAPKKTGKYTITIETENTQGESATTQIIIKVISANADKKPTISLNGDNMIDLKIGQNYKELGAEAFDKEDGNISDKIQILGNVDTTKVGVYKVEYKVKDSAENSNHIFRIIKVKDNTTKYFVPAYSFEDIKALLKDAKDGNIQNATYICLGDSTRAISDVQNSQKYFNTIDNKLKNYNVTSYLEARGSHRLEQFLDESMHPTLGDVLNDIPGDGSTTLLDLSLGVNDLFHENDKHKEDPLYFTKYSDEYKKIIKNRLIEAITKIRESKPKTSIFLVTPNPTREWEDATELMVEIYKEVAQEQNLPLANFTHDKMKDGLTTDEENEFDDWYRNDPKSKDGKDGIHFSDKGLDELSSYVLSKILPN
jgi:lysophospholipase L1-like esterase